MKQQSPSEQLSLFSFIDNQSPERTIISRNKFTQKNLSKNDSTENTFLQNLWLHIRLDWFPHRPDLDKYQVYWSTRSQLRTLASCCFESKRITVARELSYEKCKQWLEPLLYHEMCHAYLDTTKHSKEFKRIEKRHPLIKFFDNWIDSGGWETAIRSDRAKRSYQRRMKQKQEYIIR